ncbi:DUF1549 and DUF1553 domain-containing protein [Planctomycetota bacterium]|nr:DUF1549 and DUF1553 domain-containing protein [Planctomycetota bacterium]
MQTPTRPFPVRLVVAAIAVASVSGGLLMSPAAADPGDEDATAARTLAPTADVSAQIDELMEAAWKEADIRPARASTDAEFLRRVALDTTGTVPDEQVVRGFLSSSNRAKRQDAIRVLLQSEGFARFTALRWSYLLVGRDYLTRTLNRGQMQQAMSARESGMDSAEGSMSPGGMDLPEMDGPVPPLTAWLESQIHSDTPWSQTVSQLLTASGELPDTPQAHYMLRYLRNGKAEELAGSSMRLFQGLQIQCAQCHDHPYTAWTQRDFYGVAAFFSRTNARRKRDPSARNGRGPFYVTDRGNGQIRIPAPEGEHQQMVLPRFLTGEITSPGPNVDRRAELASLVTADSNPYFARAIVNRFWSFYFGRGIIDPVDDMEIEEYPIPEVLDLLARDFKASNYDLRRLSEVILLTRAYQLSSAGDLEDRGPQLELFARAPLRTLSAEQVFYSVLTATGVADVQASGRARRRIERMKVQMLRQFLQTFDNDEGEEAVDEGTIPQALLLLNGPLTNDAIKPRPDHPVYSRLFAMRDSRERVETLYLRTLGRSPTGQELRVAAAYLDHPDHRRAAGQAQAFADLFWALLNSSEFAHNH